MVRWIGLSVALGVGLMACAPSPEVTGRALFQDHCAACHGAEAQGGAGPDLTGIAGREGGVFPSLAVMEHIDGYARGPLLRWPHTKRSLTRK